MDYYDEYMDHYDEYEDYLQDQQDLVREEARREAIRADILKRRRARTARRRENRTVIRATQIAERHERKFDPEHRRIDNSGEFCVEYFMF